MTSVDLSNVGAPTSFRVHPLSVADQPRNGGRSDAEPSPRNLLLISYAFPPTGGGGVQRPAKFAKYLPAHGWQPTVLTVANPSVPVSDHDLAEELDPKMQVLRARTWEPGYGFKKQLSGANPSGRTNLRGILRRYCMRFLQPDPQVLWNGPAMRLAVKSIRKHAYDAILVTGPPFSSFLLGSRLKQRFGLPLVLDFRDEWLLACKFFENHQHSGAGYRKQYAMMQKVLKAADAVITTTEASRQELARHCQTVNSRAPVQCIYNGFDPDDFLESAASTADAAVPCKLRIVYTGTLWRLTDISPLVAALQALPKNQASQVELVIAGRITPEQQQILAGLDGSGASLVRHDYLPHREALKLAATADYLLLLLADESGAERVVPAKLFEYLALQKPMIAVCAPGEASNLVRAHGAANLFQPHETMELTQWLNQRTRDWPRNHAMQAHASAEHISPFSRPSLTKQLSDVLNHAVSCV